MASLREQREKYSSELQILRQNDLLTESRFLSFAKDRGVAVHGVTKGDPGDFHRRGWLDADGLLDGEHALFHPFRVYPLIGIIKAFRFPLTVTIDTNPETAATFVAKFVEGLPNEDGLGERARELNEVADLAVLLEPLYWPRVVGRLSRSVFIDEAAWVLQRDEYGQSVRDVVAGLDPERWKMKHESLRVEGGLADRNSDLYLLLRLSDWQKRKQLKGAVALALWLRHIGEVIRRGFEEVHGVVWPEEDEAFGVWAPRGRRLAYGSGRPLDSIVAARARVVSNYRLQTGSIVRWYVEGTTEFYAIQAVVPKPALLGIELVNLKGQIAAEKGNAALGLQEGLVQDLALGRFSMISIDADVPANLRVLRQQVQENRVVGSIHVNQPDFEFANFALDELVQVASTFDEQHGVSGDPVRQANWGGVSGAKEFEARYRAVSLRRRSIKGKKWGEALAAYAGMRPNRLDTGDERPIWRAIGNAQRSRLANYDRQKERYRFDPDTFASVEIKDEGEGVTGDASPDTEAQ
jgi:hypothetical protein